MFIKFLVVVVCGFHKSENTRARKKKKGGTLWCVDFDLIADISELRRIMI